MSSHVVVTDECRRTHIRVLPAYGRHRQRHRGQNGRHAVQSLVSDDSSHVSLI